MSSLKDMPHFVLADRVWAGSKYAYPNIERLLSALAECERERDAARRECAAWREGSELFSLLESRPRTDEGWAWDDKLRDSRTAHDTTAPNWQKEIQQ